MSILKAANDLNALGWCILPVPHREKCPRIKWGTYQTTRPAESDLLSWFSEDTGMAVVCGPISENLVCLDFDVAGSYEHWRSENPDLASQLPTDQRGDRFHVFARLPVSVNSQDLYLPGFGRAGELLCEGKLAVLPPTLHPSGESRIWLIEPSGHIPLTSLEELGIVTVQSQPKEQVTSRLIDQAIPEGQRHRTLLSLAAKLRNQGHTFGLIRDLVSAVNDSRCNPPLPFQEVEKVAEWAARKEALHHHPLRNTNGDDTGNNGTSDSSNIITAISIGDDDESRFGQMFKACPEYLIETSEDFSFVVDGFLPETYLVVLGGTSKAGKSCFVTSLAMAVAEGESFLGFETQKGAVLWCAYEESEAERAMALREFGKTPEGLYITHEKVLIDKPEGIAALRFWIRKTGAKLLVIDPLYGANTAESLADGRKARETLAGLKELCRTERVCAVVIHHFNKAVGNGVTRERFADSNQILATASMDLLMDSSENQDGSRDIQLQGRGRGSFANQTWNIRSAGIADFELKGMGKGPESDKNQKLEEIQTALRMSDEPLTAEAISVATQQNRQSVRNRLTTLVKEGVIEPCGTFGKATLYRLTALKAEPAA